MEHFKYIYVILSGIFNANKHGKEPDKDLIGPDALCINWKYWTIIMEQLQEEGLIKGLVPETDVIGEGTTYDVYQARLTMKGVEYLHKNPLMEEVRQGILENKKKKFVI